MSSQIEDDLEESKVYEKQAAIMVNEKRYEVAIESLNASISCRKEANDREENYCHLYLMLGDIHLRLNDRQNALSEFWRYLSIAVRTQDNLNQIAKIYYFYVVEAYQSHRYDYFIHFCFEVSREILNSPLQRTGDTFCDFFLLTLVLLPDEKSKLEPIYHIYSNFISQQNFISLLARTAINNITEDLIKNVMEITRHGLGSTLDPFLEKIKTLLLSFRSIFLTCDGTDPNIQQILKFLNRHINDLTLPNKLERLHYIFKMVNRANIEDTSDSFAVNRAIGWFYMILRKHEISQYFFRLCFDSLESEGSVKSLQLAELHEDLGYAYLFNRMGKESLHHFTKSFMSRQSCGKMTDSETARYYFNYALALQRKDSFEDAIKWFRKASLLLKNENDRQNVREFIHECYIDLDQRSDIEIYSQKIQDFYDECKKTELIKKQEVAKNEKILISPAAIEKYTVKNAYYVKQSRNSSIKVRIFFPNAVAENVLEADSVLIKELSSRECDIEKIAMDEFECLVNFSEKGHQFLKVYDFSNETCDGCFQYRILMEKCRETLKDYFINTRLDESKVMEIVRDLVDGFLIMKQERFVHGDINPNNIFISDYDQAKIGDLGSAKEIEETDRNLIYMPESATVEYLSPEMYVWFIMKNEHLVCNPCKSDVFSLGLTLLECCEESISGLNNLLSKDLNQDQISLIRTVNIKGFSELDSRSRDDKIFYYLTMDQLQCKIKNTLQGMENYRFLKPTLKKMLRVNYKERITFDELAYLVRK